MAQIHINNLDDADLKKIQQKATEYGLSTNAFIRRILKDYLQKSPKNEPSEILKAIRVQVTVLAEALGRTQGASVEGTEKLKKTLLKIFDQEVQ